MKNLMSSLIGVAMSGFTVLLLSTGTVMAAGASGTRPSAASDMFARQDGIRQQVANHIREVYDAYSRNDVATYFSGFKSDTIFVVPGGLMSTAEYRAMWEKTVTTGGGVQTLKLDDLRVAVSPLGDSAIATFHLSAVYKKNFWKPDAELKPFPINLLLSEVFFKEKDGWKMVYMGGTDLSPPAEEAPAGSKSK